MKSATIRLVALIFIAGMAAGCANTIRGFGQDAANAVDATQDVGRKIERAAR